ncbi:unnamed protein product [Symbiodinium sp. CCMP2592]|nr:unnamed protein product [Symbiodinium sp. CCMP2592]
MGKVGKQTSQKRCKKKVAAAKRKAPWNKGRRQTVADSQNIFLQKEDLPLFWAVMLLFCGPVYLAVVWLCMISQRRISEVLRIRGKDFFLFGGPQCDTAHVLFQARSCDKMHPGMGKLRGGVAVSRLSRTAQDTITTFLSAGLSTERWSILESYRASHPELFANVHTTAPGKFQPKGLEEDALWFPSPRSSSKCPWLSRQSVWTAIDRSRKIMFQLTKKRCFNPELAFRSSHITVHGATRHTAAALLLCKTDTGAPGPSEPAIMALQARTDVKTFQKHYVHSQERDLVAAVEHNAIPLLPTPTPTRAPEQDTEAAPKEKPNPTSAPEQDTEPAPKEKRNPTAAPKQDTEAAAKEKPKQSRNAWRHKKRREGLQKFKALGDKSL